MSLQTQAGKSTGRLLSLDALRGFDMFWIIGGGSALKELLSRGPDCAFLKGVLVQFTHVKWEGFRAWDLIMPLFLFVAGTTMPFSFAKRLTIENGRKKLYVHIVKRVAILFILGLIAQGHLLDYDLSTFRFHCNTLMTIGAGYLVASIIILNMNLNRQIITTAMLLLLFWALMTLVPVPGHGAGVLTRDGNLAVYIDKLILGRFEDVNHTLFLSSITFGCTVMLGALGGHLLRSEKSHKAKVLCLLAAGSGCLVLGLVWSNWFPIIKNLWTSSFVLLTTGISYLLLALFYLIIDVYGLKKWAFGFVVIGTNAIMVYMATILFDFRKVGNIFVGSLEERLGEWNGFVQHAAAFAVVWLILFWMYHKKSFIKI
ncbi:MAG: acyltransferase family protein [Planctomycetota bacterium]|jgi:predicted acyltransferase